MAMRLTPPNLWSVPAVSGRVARERLIGTAEDVDGAAAVHGDGGTNRGVRL